MAIDSTMQREMIGLLGRLVGSGPLPPDLQREAFAIFAQLVRAEPQLRAAAAPIATDVARFALTESLTATANRRLVYIHGICRHSAGFSDPWWNALQPFVPVAFGEGALGQTRLEVLWSDLVNQAASRLIAADEAAPAGVVPDEELRRRRAAEEIKEALRDRADQQVLAAAVRSEGLAAAPMAADTRGLISIPGLNCIDDFSIYLVNDGVRQDIIDRFTAVVRPELEAGRELDIIGHSWGTVVAYEGLRELEDAGVSGPHIRNFFTVGSALSIGPVKMRLRDANKDGRKPASVRRWVNLDAHGDIVGGPLQGRPYEVDFDFVNLEPVGCGSFFGLVSPQCAHGSYFDAGNVVVNQSIFARHIDMP